MKVIITTRLKAGWTNLFDAEEYVRLFPFDTTQINEFFKGYTGEKGKITYDMIKEQYALKINEIGKPLFCWMFAITQSPALSDHKISFDGTIGSDNAKRALIFQQFIHSIIMGKHESQKQDYYKLLEHFHYEEDIEKKVLGKIAALKQIYPTNLTQKLVTNVLKRFGLSSKIIEQMLEPILTSYFYFQAETEGASNVSREELLDFMHESLKEYLVAEYYIESLFNDNKQHRLCIGIPNEETIKFLDGLLELLKNANNKSVKNQLSKFIKSLPDHQGRNNDGQFTMPSSLLSTITNNDTIIVDNAKEKIITNARIAFEEEKIVYRANLVAVADELEIWKSAMVSIDRYYELWLHRWLSVYILSKLRPSNNNTIINRTKFIQLFKEAINYIPYYLQKMEKVDLARADLGGAILAGADLRGANLKRAILREADLGEAILERAILREAILAGANLKRANLREAINLPLSQDEVKAKGALI